MRYPFLSLVSVVWYLAVVALLVRTPHEHAPTAKSFVPVAVQVPRQSARLADSEELAMRVLMQAKRFTSATVGFGGITPPEVLAWRVIAEREDAEVRFATLAASANLATASFGAAGLAYVAPNRLPGVRRLQAERLELPVATMQGCILADRDFGTLINELETGEWWPAYIRGASAAAAT